MLPGFLSEAGMGFGCTAFCRPGCRTSVHDHTSKANANTASWLANHLATFASWPAPNDGQSMLNVRSAAQGKNKTAGQGSQASILAICGCNVDFSSSCATASMAWITRHKSWLWIIGFVAALTIVAPAAGANDVKRVIVLHSFGRDFKPWNEYATRIRAELDRQSRWTLEIHDHSLINARTGQEKLDSAFADYLAALYEQHSPDLVISIGAPAANFVQHYRSRLFPATPMVFTAVEQRRVRTATLTALDVVDAFPHDFRGLFEAMLQLLPDTRRIVVINGASPNEKFWLNEIRKETVALQGRVEFLWYEDASFEEILKRTAVLPPDSAIFWHLMNVDAAGIPHEGDRSLVRLFQSANAPIFTYADTFFGRAIVGGPMLSVEQGSRQAAEVAVRVLAGESPEKIEVRPLGYAAPKYDWRLLQRWGIDEARLPPGSQVLFRATSIWQRYYWQIALACAALLVQSGFIVWLLNERRQRHLAQFQSRQRMTELAHVNRQAVAGELTASISHELNQPLGAILANIEAVEAMLKTHSPDLKEIRQIVADIKRDDHRASEVIRRLRSLLKKTPFDAKAIDLNDIVRETVDFVVAVARMRGVPLRLSMTDTALPIRGDAIQLQQVIMNLMLNAADAMAHTRSEQRLIEIRTERVRNMAELSVWDTGPGIPPDRLKEIFDPFVTTKENGMGMGLSIARTIVEAHSGTISATNRKGEGAAFLIMLPLVA